MTTLLDSLARALRDLFSLRVLWVVIWPDAGGHAAVANVRALPPITFGLSLLGYLPGLFFRR